MISEALLGLLWGKTERGSDRYHPLPCHMMDVGLVARLLLEHPEARHLIRLFSGLLGVPCDRVPALMGFLLSLHDLGKASPSFASKSPIHWGVLLQAGFGGSPAPISGFDHGEETLWALRDPLPSAGVLQHDLGRREADRLFLTLALALGAHHGTFYPPCPSPGYPEVPPFIDDREPWRDQWRGAREALVEGMRDIFLGGERPIPCRPGNLSALCALLSGLAILSDWIGSDELFFPPYSGPLSAYPAEARKRASRALQDRSLFSFLPVPEQDPSYASLFPDQLPPRSLQEALGPGKMPDLPAQGLVIIEAPTGEGKTEAALLVASRLAALGACRGLYFGLPTVATSNQMYDRVAAFLRNHLDDGEAATLLLVNGQAEFHEGYATRLRGSRSESADPDRAVLVDRWLLPRKRSLLSPYGVGTVDQAMMAALNVRHVALRLLGLAAKVLVIDEVHAYDLYMSTILDRLLSWARVLGTSVILLSATLPAVQRERLIAAYTGGEGAASWGEGPPEAAYPCITVIDGTSSTSERTVILPEGSVARRRVALERRPDEEGAREGNARYLLEMVRKRGCACWVCNTVLEAQRCYLELRSLAAELPYEESPELLLFHARYPLGDRRLLEEAVVSRFGRSAKRPVRAILVATQVVEQSLDLDFDLMATQLAPVDLLIQRIGRLWRHDRDRPDHLTGPRLVLLMPPQGPNGPQFGNYGRVYQPYLLLRTLAVLHGRDSITSPDDVRTLVEAVYGDRLDKATAVAEIDLGLLERARQAWEKDESRQQGQAKLRLLGVPDAKGGFHHNLGFEMDEDAAEVDAWVAAATRLSEPSARVVLLRQGDPLLEHPDLSKGGDVSHDLELSRSLLLRSVSISHRPLALHVASGKDSRLRSLDHLKGLRGHRLIVLEDGAFEWKDECGAFRLELSEELGVIIERRDIGVDNG